MSETESQYVRHLLAVRDAHVQARRRAAANAIDSSVANKEPIGLSWGQDIGQQQELIETIDRAIADETKLTGRSSVSASTA